MSEGMDDASTGLLLAAAVFFAAGIAKGVTGMGLPTVAMALLTVLLSPLTAASLLIVPAFVTNVWQLLAAPGLGALLRRFWPMMLAIALGTIIGAPLLTGGDTGVAASALGGALVLYAGFTLLAPPFRVAADREPWLSPLVGAITGAATGCTGVFVIPAVPYLQALGLEKDALVQALGLSFTVSTVALAIGLAMHHAFQIGHIALSVLAVVPSLAGMWTGQVIRKAIDAAAFRRWFLIALIGLGAEMLLRPLL